MPVRAGGFSFSDNFLRRASWGCAAPRAKIHAPAARRTFPRRPRVSDRQRPPVPQAQDFSSRRAPPGTRLPVQGALSGGVFRQRPGLKRAGTFRAKFL